MAVRGGSATEPAVARSTLSEQWLLVVAATILVGGMFADGRAHSTLELDSFFTPPHTIIFIGYLVALAVMVLTVRSRLRGVAVWRHAIPVGWGAAILGVLLFGLGFLGDGAWHTVFGIEADLEALLSPSHLILLAGGLAIFSAPVMAQWSDARSEASWRVLGPAIAAAALSTAAVSFFLFWIWPVSAGVPLRSFSEFAGQFERDAQDALIGLGNARGLAGYVIFAVVLVAPLLFLERRWRLPTGAIFLITVLPWVGMLYAFDLVFAWVRLIPVVVGAIIAEVGAARWVSAARSRRWRVIAPLLVLTVFALDMLVMQLRWGLGWPAEFVAGTAMFAAFAAYGIALLAVPPKLPEADLAPASAVLDPPSEPTS